MSWCYECEKNIAGDSDICPECGALLDANADCGGDCDGCALDCTHEHDGELCDGCSDNLWPVDDGGETVKPAFLMNVSGTQIDYELTVSLLRSFGIPTARDYPNAGRFVRMITGITGGGMDIYIPENMLELAKELLNAAPTPD